METMASGVAEFPTHIDRSILGEVSENHDFSKLTNPDVVAFADCVEESDDIDVAQFDATPAEGLADTIFMIGAVDIDVALVAVAAVPAVLAGFQAAEPNDTGGNQVATLFLLGVIGKMLTGGDAAFKDHAQWFAIADLVGQCVQSERCAVGISLARGRIFRGRNRKNALHCTVADERKFLSLNRNDYLTTCRRD